MKLYETQLDLKADINTTWRSHRNVLAVSATGSGKTVVAASIVKDEPKPSIVIAHRKEILTQISGKLAAFGLPHNIIARQEVINDAIAGNVLDVGEPFIHKNARVHVAGVDTLLARKDSLTQFGGGMGLWLQDEAHHVLDANKWGKVLQMFPNAKGLGMTANTVRSDGKGLGRGSHGVFDTLVLGEPMRGLMERGQLSTYTIIAAPTDFDRHRCKISSSTGDMTQAGLKAESKRSHITGDIVQNYIKYASGKRAIAFVTDVETACEVAHNFNIAGVRAEVVTAKTKNSVRSDMIRRFKAGEILVLVNVDLFGEGFDVPSVQCVIMARPTESFNLYCQQFGRALRPPLPGIIIDHVSNWVRHGLPEDFEAWSLEPRGSKGKKKGQPEALKSCVKCLLVYKRFLPICPYCGHQDVPAERSRPEQVDGDLTIMDLDYIRAIRAKITKQEAPVGDARAWLSRMGLGGLALAGAVKQHGLRREMQAEVREAVAIWGARRREEGMTDAQAYRKFFLTFGHDVLAARTLKLRDAENLLERIKA